jgi:hypothetical protein
MTKKRDEIRDYLNETSKPLTWRTGPVKRFEEVFYEWEVGDAHGVGFGLSNGNVQDWVEMPYTALRHIPLSDILNLIGVE